MLYRFTFLLLCTLLSQGFLAQTSPAYFEGQIVYTNTYTSKDPKLSSARLANMFGGTHNYFICKNGDYKTETNGMFAQWQMYISSQNRIYNKMTFTDTVFWNSGLQYDDELLNVKVNKNVMKILGYDCDELVLTCKSGVQKYYYSSKLPINPDNYKGHFYGNYFNYISRAKALALKMIIEDPGFIMECTATSVTPKAVSKELFVLPPAGKLKKSAY